MPGNNYKDMAEAFTIFAKYDEGVGETAAEHDEIYAGPSPEKVSEGDRKRLEELGWWSDESYDCWRRFV